MDISIIIVNWNGIEFLPACIRSIVENPPSASYEIVVVDNGSFDGSLEWLKSFECRDLLNGADLRIIESSENLGFGRGNNLAIEQTTSPLVFLLNPDAVLRPKTIDNLLLALNGGSDIGVAAPKLLNSDGTVQKSVFHSWFSPLTVVLIDLGLLKFLPKRLTGNWLLAEYWTYDKIRDVPGATGAALLCRRQMINEVGGFDPDFFMYYEDNDWCIRIRNANWRIIFYPEAEVEHLCSRASAGRWTNMERELIMQNSQILYEHKWFNPLLFCGSRLASLLVLLLRIISRKVRGIDIVGFDKLIRLHWNEIVDLVR